MMLLKKVYIILRSKTLEIKYFFNDGSQIYVIFQTLYYTLKRQDNTEKLRYKNLKVCQPKKCTTPTSDNSNSLSPSIKYHEDSKFCLVLLKKELLKIKKHNLY